MTLDRPPFDAEDLFRRAQGLRPGPLGQADRRPDAGAAARYALWCRYVAGGDRRRMRRRLRRDGLWPSAVRHARTVPEPAWAGTLRAVMEAARAPDSPADPSADPFAVPFADALAPAIRVMRARLERGLAERGVPAGPAVGAVADGMERAVLARLSRIAGPALFAAFRRAHPADLLATLLGGAGDGVAPTGAYRAFVADTLADGFAGLFMRYPALARSVCLTVERCADAGAELCGRLAADAGALAATFGVAGPVAAVEAGLSDPHAGGRTVARVRFADGRSVACKPRDMAMEAIFSGLLRWVNGRGLRHAHRVPAVLERDGYGWMEWVEPAPCRDAAEMAAYWWRAGSLMALYTALDGSDLHCENLIAAGAHPVLVDVECLLHPRPSTILGQPDLPSLLMPGLLTSGFLPTYAFGGADGRVVVNLAAFGPPGGPDGLEEPGFANAGTDWIAPVRRRPPFPTGHVPALEGRPGSPADHVDAIVAGFTETRRLLMAHVDWLLDAPESPLARLGGAPGRFLPRPTSSYGLLLDKVSAADAMADGVDFAIVLEALHRNAEALPEGMRALAPLETADLEALDVPRFTFRPADTRVHDAAGRPLAELWAEAPLAAMARRLRACGEAELAYDAALIRAALPSGQGGGLPPVAAAPAGGEEGGATPREVLRAVADAIAGAAVERPDGTVHWVGLSQSGTSGLAIPQPSGLGLYDGGPGVALFLAAAGRVLDDDRLGRLARRALEPARRLFAGPQAGTVAGTVARGLGPGYATGLGGLITALAGCGDLLDDAALTGAAARVAERSRDALGAGHPHDLLGGDAGLVLALLSLHARTRAAGLVDAASAAGERALAAAVREGDALCWPLSGGAGLTGLSHGAAGFALAFAHLHRATGQACWRDAMAGALAFERRHFLPEHDNWPDLRPGPGAPGGGPRLAVSWCHGAPGIALGRLGVLAALGDDVPLGGAPGGALGEAVAEDLAAALRATVRHALLDGDDLCCGNGGRLDILRTAGRALDRPELVAAADAGLRRRLDHVCRDGRCRLWHGDLPVVGGDPHLFKGLAGFGYTLARAVDPALVPDVLLPGPAGGTPF